MRHRYHRYLNRRAVSITLALFALLATGAGRASAAGGLYGQTISLPTTQPSPSLKSVSQDAADTLHKVTGQPFTVAPTPEAQGIVLRLETPTTTPTTAPTSVEPPPETFTIRSTRGSDQLVISAPTEAGLIHGLYYYLDQLGCRWYFPTDNWTILPSRQDITLTIDRTLTPAFTSRSTFGSGGYGPLNNPVDPKLVVRDRWERWRQRNGDGGTFKIGGHVGEAFNTRNRKTLEAHPEYFAELGGQRQPWAMGTKLCVSNPDLVKLFVEDRLAELRKWPNTFAVSVEPADGGGYCACSAGCAEMGANDQPFFLANEVARAVAKEFPGRRVSLLAYGMHADIPKFDVEPNVYVSVVPYGFQRTSMSGDELLQAWRRKVPRIGMYTYWSIPDWSRDYPDFNWHAWPAERIPFWQATGVECLGFESTSGAGAIGLGEYLAKKLMWDPKRDVKPMIDEFFEQCFGPAQVPMRRMLMRWAYEFLLIDQELAMSYLDLNEAMQLAGTDNPAIAARLDDYAKYLHYLRLSYEMYGGETPEALDTRRRTMAWIWRISDSCMVHSFRIAMLISYRWLPSETLRAEFDVRNPAAAGWVEAKKPLTSEDVRALVAEGMAKYKPVEYERRQYSAELLSPPPPKFATPTRWGPRFSTTGGIYFEFEASEELKSLPIQIAVGRTGADPPNAVDPVTLTDAQGKELFRTTIPINTHLHELSIPIPKAGRYVLTIIDAKRGATLHLPMDLPLVIRAFASTDLSPVMYFYVPKGLEKVVMYAPGAAPLIFRDSSGTVLKPEPGGLCVIKVPPGQDGQIWSVQRFKGWIPIRMMNVPQVFSFSPATLMYPKNLKDEVAHRLAPLQQAQ